MRNLIGLIRLSFRNLLVKKLTSFLTILSIVFGSGAFIAVLCSNEGAKLNIQRELEKLGVDLIWVKSGSGGFLGIGGNGAEQTAKNFSFSDKELLGKYDSNIKKVNLVISGSGIIRYKKMEIFQPVLGYHHDSFDSLGITIDGGRFFSDVEEEQYALVALLGYEVKNTFFAKENPLGKYVYLQVNGIISLIKIIGTLKQKGGGGSDISVDRSLILPLKIGQKILAGKDKSSNFIVQVNEENHLPGTKSQIKLLLEKRYSGIQLTDAKEMVESSQKIMDNIIFVGLCLALISLVTGGIGIMNVMLMSVVQRKKEVGLRKAIGATDTNIMLQFLFEAVIICLSGGIIGMVLGIAIGNMIASSLNINESVISITPIILSLLFIIILGIIFGLFPALKASQIDPYEALRG
ncbi:MAG: ABC transporter permease [Oligoflexia bacterium]|nr:ABC transporter permease [Oligoflexia bacterium]